MIRDQTEGGTSGPLHWLDPASADLRNRLQVVAVILVASWLGFFPVRATAYAAFDLGVEEGVFTIGNQVLVVSVVLSAAVGLVARYGGLGRTALANLALVFAVTETFLIEMITNCLPIPDFPFRAVPWTVVWILVFPVVVPMGSRRTLIGGLLAASMTPVSFVAWDLLGRTVADAPTVIFWSFGVFMAALAANVPVWMLERQQRRVSQAQDQLRALGSYQLVELLGRGGMGDVWRAEHQLLARPAAIKLIRRREVADQESLLAGARARFEREAQVTASLVSPHTVALYDFGVSRDGTFFYVMELLDGLDMGELVRQFGPLPPARTVFLLRQLAASLEEAHASGLVHRDIKPANVLVCRYGRDRDFVKVLDFGMVKRVRSDELPSSTQKTQQGILGTPAYIAPEQAVQSPNVDARTDIYALGCVAYWLLTGQLVFPRDTAMEMVIAHSRDSPDAPSQHAPGPLPPELDALVVRCLAKSPTDRPQNASDFLGELDRVPLDDVWGKQEAIAWWQEYDGRLSEIRKTPLAGAERRVSETWTFDAR